MKKFKEIMQQVLHRSNLNNLDHLLKVSMSLEVEHYTILSINWSHLNDSRVNDSNNRSCNSFDMTKRIVKYHVQM